MPIESSFYLQQQAPDIMGGIERGLRMSDLIQQRRDQRAEREKQTKLKELISQNTIVDDAGNVSYGPGLTKSLAQAGLNQEAMQIQKQNQEMAQSQKKMALDDAKYFVEMGSSLLTRAKQYPGSWGNIRQEMLKLPGINPAEIPEAYPGEKWIAQHETALLPMKEKLGLTKLEADIANTKANTWKTQQEAAKIGKESQVQNDPQSKIAKLNTSDKARFDNAKLGLEYVQKMAEALDKGDRTFSLWGDNNFTDSQRYAAEAFGRMQSGGAINKDEEERFRALAPGMNDSKEMQRQKLLNQQKLFADRLETLGFTPQQAGVKVKEIIYGLSDQEKKVKEAGLKMPTPEQALQLLQQRQLERQKNGG